MSVEELEAQAGVSDHVDRAGAQVRRGIPPHGLSGPTISRERHLEYRPFLERASLYPVPSQLARFSHSDKQCIFLPPAIMNAGKPSYGNVMNGVSDAPQALPLRYQHGVAEDT